MKRVIRKGVFESNSSSCHAICVAKEKPDPKYYPKKIRFSAGDFGWEERFYDSCDCASYLYTLILNYTYDNKKLRSEYLNHIVDVLGKVGVECEFVPPKVDNWGFEDGYVDHYGEAQEFFGAVMHNDNRLIRFLLGDSQIITGNDNNEWWDEYMAMEFDPKPYEVYYKYN